MFPLPYDIKMKENQGVLKFIVLHQFLLYTVGVIWEGDHNNMKNNAEIILLVRQEIILKLNIDKVEGHERETVVVYIYIYTGCKNT
jgi:hypothetical protein